MLKKATILFQIISVFSLSAYAQERNLATQESISIHVDTLVQESSDKYQVITNKFWDNWFIGAGAGAQLYFGDFNREMKFGDRFTPAYAFYLGKSFTPVIAVRAGVSGLKVKGLTRNGAHATGERYRDLQSDGIWLQKQELEYYHIHGDVLFNLMNVFGGYRESRFYTLSPYLGLGWMIAHKEPKAKEVSANVGFFNSFRLGQAVDLTLDIRGSMVNDRFDGETGGRKQEGLLSTTLGLVYKFKQRGWSKPSITTITQGYDDAVLAQLREKIDALAHDNEALRNQLANSKTGTVTDIKVDNKLLAVPILVTFPINKSTVNKEARVNLGFFADVIKKGPANVVYKVTGYADKGTGSNATNERLSRERAEAVRDVLVNEFEVDPSQLEISAEGGVDNMFYNDPHLSRAVITIAK